MEDENNEIVPKRQSLFPLKPEDIVDNALENLDEQQARRVTEKAADEIVRLAVEKRKAEYRSEAAQGEMRNVVENANLLDQRGGDYKISSTFETASGTTNVEIQKSKPNTTNFIIIGIALLVFILILLLFVIR